MLANTSDWVVLKFGGTSVSSAANWHNIAAVVRQRAAAGLRPAIVHSALSGVTDRLESLLKAAVTGQAQSVLDLIDDRHRELARELDIVPSARFEGFIADLAGTVSGLAGGVALDERVRARVMAMGELPGDDTRRVVFERARHRHRVG